MTQKTDRIHRLTKGERTRLKLLDAAEKLFASKGYSNTSLRDIAANAGIQEPGIYNHFKGKDALYSEVLDRALQPLADAIEATIVNGAPEKDLVTLPAKLTDLLADHPAMPALFHQALIGSPDDTGHTVITHWLAKLFAHGENMWAQISPENRVDKQRITLRMILMFNAVTGYFLSQKLLNGAGAGDMLSPENLAEQKRLLAKVMQLFILEL